MAAAQKLMFKHDLHMLDIADEQTKANDPIHSELDITGKTKQWKGMLIHYIATPLNCMAVRLQVNSNLSRWTLIGTKDNIEFVQLLHQTLVPWLESQAKIARNIAQAQHPTNTKPFNPNAFNRAFYDHSGFVIGSRLFAQREAMTTSDKGTALVTTRTHQNQDYASNLYGKIKTMKKKGFSNTAGQHAGSIAGAQADITPGRKVAKGGRHTLNP